nr:uncharacterized protein LOC123774245 [Procambarus clarkii]
MNVSVGVDNWVIHLCPKYSLLNTSIINQTLHWRSPTPNTIFFTDTSCGINFTPRQVRYNFALSQRGHWRFCVPLRGRSLRLMTELLTVRNNDECYMTFLSTVFIQVTFLSTVFTQVTFLSTVFTQVTFPSSVFTQVTFPSSVFTQVTFPSSVFTQVTFPSSVFTQVTFPSSVFTRDLPVYCVYTSDLPVYCVYISDLPVFCVYTSDLPVSRIYTSNLPVSCVYTSDLPVFCVYTSDLPIICVYTSDLPIICVYTSDLPACAVESAAHHHPHRPVLLMVTAPAVRPHPLLQIVEDLGNVELVYLDLDQVFDGPPLQSWHSQRLWLYIEERSSIFVSDAARVELLRRYGGTYLDLDALTLRPLPDLEPYVGRVSSTHAGNGVMSFPPRHPLIQAMADDLPRAFNPTECCSIGPYLITRHLHNWCPGNFTIPRNTSNRAKETCQDITIYPERAFCPIKWTPVLTELQGVFFNGMGLGAKFLKDASDVYSLHLYNSLSKEERVELKGDSIIEEVAKRNCPKVYDFLLTHNMAI